LKSEGRLGFVGALCSSMLLRMPEPDDSQSIHPLHDRFVKDFLHEPAEASDVFQTALPELARALP
jgi:hypothetical protein